VVGLGWQRSHETEESFREETIEEMTRYSPEDGSDPLILRKAIDERELSDEVAALQQAMSLQTRRRATTDGELHRLCEQYDRLMDRGRPSDRTRKIQATVGMFHGHSPSAERTAQLLGCNYKKVEKIRKIRKDGTPEIQEAVKNDSMSINRAYNLIRKMEKGEDEEKSRKELLAAQIKAAEILLSRENLARMKKLGGDLRFLVNLAVEQFVLGLRDKWSTERRGQVLHLEPDEATALKGGLDPR